MKTIKVPDRLYKDFITFLDIAQSSYTDEDLQTFSKNELKVIDFIEKLVKTPTQRKKTKQERLALEKELREAYYKD